MEDHLGYPKHEKADKPNKRNGHTKKTVRSDTGDLEISTLVRKHQTRISGLDDKIIFHYSHSLPSCASGKCLPDTC
jgi:transposase-like protein